MAQEKSPFEEIFKREEERQESKKKEEESILNALDKEEKNVLGKSEEVKIEEGVEGAYSEEDRYRNLVDNLLESHYFDEAIKIISEMKAKFGF